MALRAVPDHPKFAHLKSLLSKRDQNGNLVPCPKSHALGYLEAIWHFTGRFTPQGNIGKYSDLAIESWLEWDGEEGKLIDVLIKSGWIDIDDTHRLIVHDWHQHADKAARQALGRAGLKFVVPEGGTVCVHRGHAETKMETAVGTAGGLPVPVPEPAPVPESKTPPSRARDAESEPETGFNGEIPEGLPILAYARGVLETLAVPVIPATTQAAAAAIGAVRKETSLAANLATGELIRHARDALARGEVIDKWWFTDAKWRKKEGVNGHNSNHSEFEELGTLIRSVRGGREMADQHPPGGVAESQTVARGQAVSDG